MYAILEDRTSALDPAKWTWGSKDVRRHKAKLVGIGWCRSLSF